MWEADEVDNSVVVPVRFIGHFAPTQTPAIEAGLAPNLYTTMY